MTRNSVVCAAMVCLAGLMVWGCATSPAGPSDEELILKQLETLREAVLAKEPAKVEDLVSEDFYYPALGDKEAALEMLEQGINMGITENGEIDLGQVEVEIEGAQAKAGPVDCSSPVGAAYVDFTLSKEEGVWRITGGTADGF